MISKKHALYCLIASAIACYLFASLNMSVSSVQAAVSMQVGVIRSGVPWYDNNSNPINAHGAGMIKVGTTYYMIGEARTTNNFAVLGEYETPFNATACYSSQDLEHWSFVGNTLMPQSGTDIAPNRIVERPKILYNASTNQYVEFVHTANAADFGEDYLNYATSSSVCGQYTLQGRVYFQGTANAVQVGDIGSFQDSDGTGYIMAAGGMIYRLTADYHSIAATVVSGMCNACEGPALFKTSGSYFAIFSSTRWWRSNDNFYYSAPSASGPWTYRGLLAPGGSNTWNSQSSFVLPVQGSSGTTYIFTADRWCDTCLTSSTSVWQPLTVNGTTLALSTFYAGWSIDVNAGTWTTVADTNMVVNDAATGNGPGQFSYVGSGWGHNLCQSGDNCYNGDNSWDNTTNDYTLMQFTGTQVNLYAVVASNHGLAAAAICNVQGDNCDPEFNIDLYSANRAGNQLVWSSPVKAYGSYTLKVRVTGGRNNYSSNTYITIDRVTVATDPVNPYSYYKLVNRNSGSLMNVYGQRTDAGAPIIQYHDEGATNAQWGLIASGGGSYTIINRNSLKVLEDPGASSMQGTQLDQGSSDGGAYQEWYLNAAVGGYYTLVNGASGLNADVSGASTADVAVVMQWSDNGGANQQWQLVPVTF